MQAAHVTVGTKCNDDDDDDEEDDDDDDDEEEEEEEEQEEEESLSKKKIKARFQNKEFKTVFSHSWIVLFPVTTV